MRYIIRFTYKDKEVKECSIDEQHIETFFSDLSRGQMHSSLDTGEGFWTPLDQIKYIEAIPTKEGDAC